MTNTQLLFKNYEDFQLPHEQFDNAAPEIYKELSVLRDNGCFPGYCGSFA